MHQSNRLRRWVTAFALGMCTVLCSGAALAATAVTKPCSEVKPASEQDAAKRAGLCVGLTLDEAKAAAARRAARAAAVTAAATHTPPAYTPPACQPLPDFVGKGSTFDQARAALPGAYFKPQITATRTSSAPRNTILAQSTQALDGRLCWANFVVSDGSLVKVPALGGMTRDQAAQAILALQLKPDLREMESEMPVGRVFRQAPSTNAEVARGTAVLAQIAKPLTWPIPALVGMDVGAALSRLGPFKPSQVTGASLRRAGEVIAQTPAAGERRAKGAEVVMTVSDGSLVEVPRLVGRRIEPAQTLLTSLDLTMVRHDRAAGAAPGVVLEQSPAPGTAVKRQSAVTLQVSGGLIVPNLVGQPLAAAKGLLQRFSVTSQPEPSEQPVDEVIGQTPAAGTHVAAGTRVVLRLSDASIVTVPPTHGLQLPQARQNLRQAGNLSGLVGPDRDQPRAIVESSDPAPGTKVRRGSAVTLTVSIPTPWWAWLGGGAGVAAAGGAVIGWLRRRPSVPVGASTTVPPKGAREPAEPGAAPPTAISASLEFNTRPISVSGTQTALPTLSLHATLVLGDAQIHLAEEPPA